MNADARELLARLKAQHDELLAEEGASRTLRTMLRQECTALRLGEPASVVRARLAALERTLVEASR